MCRNASLSEVRLLAAPDILLNDRDFLKMGMITGPNRKPNWTAKTTNIVQRIPSRVWPVNDILREKEKEKANEDHIRCGPSSSRAIGQTGRGPSPEHMVII